MDSKFIVCLKKNTSLNKDVLGNLALRVCVQFPLFVNSKNSWTVENDHWKIAQNLQEPQLSKLRKIASTKNVLTDGINYSIMWFWSTWNYWITNSIVITFVLRIEQSNDGTKPTAKSCRNHF